MFFSHDFDIAAFDMLIKDKRMKLFSILFMGQYAFDVNVTLFDVNITLLSLQSQLKLINTSDLWNVVPMHVSPPPFQKILQKRFHPLIFDQHVESCDIETMREKNMIKNSRGKK